MSNVRFIIQASKGIIRDHRVRRAVMFYDMILVLVMSFLGATFLWSWLRARPVLFLGYWGACAWFTILAAVLSVYDMIRLRIEEREVRQKLKKEFLGRDDSDSSHDSHSN